MKTNGKLFFTMEVDIIYVKSSSIKNFLFYERILNLTNKIINMYSFFLDSYPRLLKFNGISNYYIDIF